MNSISYLLIFIGGGLGACLRVFLSVACSSTGYTFLGASTPTLIANVSGGFLAGIFITIFSKQEMSGIFLILGFLGGFTTFSSYSLDVLDAARTANWALCASIILAHNSLTLLAAYIGFRYSPF